MSDPSCQICAVARAECVAMGMVGYVMCPSCVQYEQAEAAKNDDRIVYVPPVTQKILRGLQHFADIADDEGQTMDGDSQAAIAWLEETGWE